MKTVVREIDRLEGELGVPLFTVEMEILAFLYENGPTASRLLMGVSRLSPAGFHIVKKRLRDRHLIFGEKSSEDTRQTLYDIAPSVRAQFDKLAVLVGNGGGLRPGEAANQGA
ncbi:MAG: hypothetical protein RLZZ08_291 [Pseudomonadota bacterium]|jgi:DNA-binding MarR family transcriptional regulator